MWGRIKMELIDLFSHQRTEPSSLELVLDLSVSYLDQDILTKPREGIFEAIKTDVMSLPHSAAHAIARPLCAAPLPVLTHTVNERAR